MSFSGDIKEELCHIEAGKNCAGAELYACIASIGSINLNKSGVSLRLNFENMLCAKRMFSHIKEYFGIDCEITVTKNNLKNKNVFCLCVNGIATLTDFLNTLGFDTENIFFLSKAPQKHFETQEEIHSFLRGLFISCGSVTNPKKDYHCEFVLSSPEFCEYIASFLKKIDVFAKIVTRKQSFVVYFKGGDNVSAFLAAIGASQAVLQLENIRIFKEMRNNVNRAVNCETANISKTVSAASKQIHCINLIKSTNGLKSLSPSLREAAYLRLENPDASLLELAEISNYSKSGINHKLRKICKIAEELQEE